MMTRYNAFAGTTIALSAVFLPLTLIVVALRILARTKTKAGIGLDDLLALFALATYFVFTILLLWGMCMR